MQTVSVIRRYLQVSRRSFKAAADKPPSTRVERIFQCAPSFYRYLYSEVGRANYWTDRLAWSDRDIQTHLNSPNVQLHGLTCHGGPAGYFELVRLDERVVEIAYLGVLPEFQGRGLGKYLLTAAVQTGFGAGATRVQLDTCTLDHPHALENYLKRGFKVVQTERFYRALPVTESERAAFVHGLVRTAEYG